MFHDRSRPRRRPYVGTPKWPMHFTSTCATDIPDEGSPTRFARWNKIVQVPIEKTEKQDTVTTWVATGGYATGDPSSWKPWPDRVNFMAEYSNEDQTFSPYDPTEKVRRRMEMKDESDRQYLNGNIITKKSLEREYDWSEPELRIPMSLLDFYRDIREFRSGLMLPVPEGRPAAHEEIHIVIDGNNSNNMSYSDYVGESEVIVYEPYVMYLYPVIPIAPDNNDPYLFEPESRPIADNDESW